MFICYFVCVCIPYLAICLLSVADRFTIYIYRLVDMICDKMSDSLSDQTTTASANLQNLDAKRSNQSTCSSC